jgi:hypothetical protein
MIDSIYEPNCKDISDWTPLQADVCMSIANAKYETFIFEAGRLAKLVRARILSGADAADYLHEAANYNQLYFEYGVDQIQAIMARMLSLEAAA